MDPRDLKVGLRVFWTDPGGGTCSAWGTVTEILCDDAMDPDDETIICLETRAGSEIEALAHELSLTKSTTGATK